ncbi:carbohydrate ABC transporter permease [Actinophytocola algeriensis]|jgi:multiple sugar transport system permease protein|uniref:Multiple sugar transport system permease protein n=1 Tax=Actinophytocola algeriensis TaxID=1768010 RepID=A0A7W7Q221_9PSEU|nr:sugar ABC transporter permease [Actinophytocola algeriensis]MBB4905438.1 multiple sugar transport system permease protein [Actinophytocola algeriensis]MBE1472877.1 multiple sugar transport system permease protein [Actinophytocola algeriensis]
MTAATVRRRRKRGDGRDAWLLVLPALVPVVLISVYPLVQGILLGFTDAEAGLNQVTNFNGLDNYEKLLHNELFWASFRIGLIWAFGVTIIQFLASLGLALLLNADLRLRWLARTLALVPWAMPPVVIAIMWRLMLNPTYGPVNETLRSLGLPGDINWLGDFSTALPAVIVVGVWAGMPQTTITLLAGLQNVSGDLHEAAAIDGASTWQRFWHVTLPALRPVIAAITSLDLIWNFNSFALVFVLTAGGPGGKTMLPMLFAYNEAFRYGNFGYAAALGNVMVVVIAAFLFFYLRGQARSRES